MNDTIHSGRPISMLSWKYGAVLTLSLWASMSAVQAQAPPGSMPPYQGYGGTYPPPGAGGAMPLPSNPQYYEYLPPGRGWDDAIESPLDRFLKQAVRQSYGRFDYLLWKTSNPGDNIIGGPGKRLRENVGFNTPAYLDPIRGPEIIGFGDDYPIRNPLLVNHPGYKVLIQTWESSQAEVADTNADGNIFDLGDTNDIDVFPRITNIAKSDMLAGLSSDVIFSTGDPSSATLDAAQVAVMAIGQLADASAFNLGDTNGFRGVIGLNTTFGAIETSFFVMGQAQAGFTFQPIPSGLIGVPVQGGGLTPNDPLVIPILVNGQMAPDVFDDSGNLITDSNNYYLIFNESYNVAFQSQSWGFAPNVFWTLNENPGLFKVSGALGFRYFDMREKMLQRGTFTNNEDDADYTYESEFTGDRLVTNIDSTTVNQVYGPQAGIRAELGDDRFKLGVDAHLMLGANTHEATVAARNVLFEGDNNFTRDASTHFTTGFETIVDARIRLREHVTLSVGYNFMWFSSVTRPHDNIYYNVEATPVVDPPVGGPDFTYNNDFVVDKKRQSVNLNGLSVGLLIDW